MENRREPGSCAGLYISGAAHDDTGHREGAKDAANEIAGTLRGEFTIVIRLRPGLHAIDCRGRQKRLRAGDKCDGSSFEDDARLLEHRKVGSPNRIEQVCGDRHKLDRKTEDRRNNRRERDRH